MRQIIPADVLDSWRDIFDIVVKVVDVPALLLWRIHEEEAEVICAAGESSVFELGYKVPVDEDVFLHGLALGRGHTSVIEDLSSNEPVVCPAVKAGLISCMRYPLRWPDGDFLGVICAFNHTADKFTSSFESFLARVADSLEKDLKLLENNRRLKEKKEHYRLIVENSVDVIWVADFESMRYLYVSPAIKEMGGYEPEEIVGEEFTVLMIPELRGLAEKLIASMKYAAANGLPIEIPQKVEGGQRRKDGGIVDTESSLIVLRDDSGKPRYLFGITRDVTERNDILRKLRKRESELEKARDKAEKAEASYRVLAEQSEDMIWVIDLATRCYTYVNPAAAKIRGYLPEEMIGTKPTAWITPASQAKVEDLFNELDYEQANDLPISSVPPIEIEAIHKDGRILYTETTVQLIRDEEGRPVSYLGISRDISHRKQIEEERRLREQELQEAKEAAEKTNREKTLFLANMSHEIRTPLSALLGLSQVMISQSEQLELPDNFIRMLEQIRSGGHYLNLMLTNILDISAIEVGKPRLNTEIFSLSKWISDLRDILDPIAKSHQVEIIWSTDKIDMDYFVSDSVRLAHILINLVHNAIKFTPIGGRAEVSIGSRHERLWLEVSDEGPGLPLDQKHSFEAFGEGIPSTSDMDHGVGLGLYIVQLNTRLLGGSVTAGNNIKGGAHFMVELTCDKHKRGECDESSHSGRQ